ncbi:UbiA family prenyltransferase [Streptomyces purpureus]|uniref:UbiA family prenyltransferase n=1 Tax=Streptomyces purpureus TaxID=1951 RepID=UPI0022787C11|nr:UbiA family prenyltransferase [Streptomyces purpureus]
MLKACHPLPAAAVTAVTAALVVAMGHGAVSGTLVVLAVAAGQLSVGWCNDRVDLARDLSVARRDKPLVTGEVSPGAVAAAAATALALCLPLSWACGWLAGCVHLGGVAAAWLYNLWLKRTRASWLPYAVAFGLLPAFVSLSLPGAPWPPLWLTVAAALLGAGAHVANVLPDIDADVATGVLGLPQRLGARRSGRLAALLVLASSVVLAVGPPGPMAPYGWLVTAATGTLALAACAPAGLMRPQVPFRAVLLIAGVDVGHLLVRSGELAPGAGL